MKGGNGFSGFTSPMDMNMAVYRMVAAGKSLGAGRWSDYGELGSRYLAGTDIYVE